MVMVSAIIGTYNRCGIVKRTIESVLSQSIRDIEVIVVDDASTDNTMEIIKTIKDNRLIYVRLEENVGIAKVSNIGFNKSIGKYIALVGDDDVWTDRDKLQKQINVFNGRSHIGLVGTWWSVVNGRQRIQKHSNKIIKNWKQRLLHSNPVCGSSALMSRESWIKAGGFDELCKRGTDSDLFRRIVLSDYSVVVLHEDMVDVYTDSPHRMTPQNSLNSINVSITAIKYLIIKYKNEFHQNPWALSIRYIQLGNLYVKKKVVVNKRFYTIKALAYYLISFRMYKGLLAIIKILKMWFVLKKGK